MILHFGTIITPSNIIIIIIIWFRVLISEYYIFSSSIIHVDYCEVSCKSLYRQLKNKQTWYNFFGTKICKQKLRNHYCINFLNKTDEKRPKNNIDIIINQQKWIDNKKKPINHKIRSNDAFRNF